MPPLLTQVARASDGLPLVATQTPAPGLPVTNQQQKEAKDLLRKITTGYVVDSGINSVSCRVFSLTDVARVVGIQQK
jgi:hypothetical protein